MPDTWGISGPLFLAFYLATIVVVLLFTLSHRRRIFKGDKPGAQTDLPPAQLGFLRDGPVRAIQTSLTWLRRNEAISIGELGRFSRRGGAPVGASDVDSAVLMAVGSDRTVIQIQRDTGVRAALERVQRDLENRGLLLTQDDRESARKGVWVLLLLLGLGIWRFIAGVSNDKPVLYLFLTLTALAVITIVMLAHRPRLTRAGQELIAAKTREFEHLKPSYRPSWNTYDPAMTAVAVGLFGTALLWEADPLLAAHTAAINQRAVAASSSTTGCSVGGDSGGGGDGGGGGGCGGGGCGG